MIDEAGLEYIGIQDHPYNMKFLDTWMVLAVLAQATEQVRLFANVSNLGLRPPLMLAKAAASLDVLSGGRIELGIGAGAYWEGIAAMGGPSRSPGESVDALEEALQLIRAFFAGERSIRFDGDYYQARGARPGPRPAHDIGIWIGAYGPRMLALTGRYGDGWVPSMSYAPPQRIPAMQERIDEAAEEAGRDPREIRRVYNVMGMITDGAAEGPLSGPVDRWVEELTRFVVELGLDTFIYWPSGDRLRQMERFANEVVPAVREAVEKARAGS
jgi:alkanesulfonate monooxygenase SsuD/methylene tetrahydromethanopterin reductase-like flavin-dependent oxidoreductase (luciferase family)